MEYGIFRELKVLELASVLAGPGVGQFFAELGAEVIKVENIRTGGDVTRSWKLKDERSDDRSAYFCAANWGKQSIAVDLSTDEGKEVVHGLARRADVVITSYKAGDAVRLGVDYPTLSALNRRLIYGEITGYGPGNVRVGYDALLQAEAGFMSMNGEPGGPSLKMPVALVDVLAGHHLKEGLLLALIERSVTGAGRRVHVSLMDAAVASLANQATNFLIAGKVPVKQGSLHPNIAPYGDVFVTRDERELLLAVGTDRQFALLCEVLELADLVHDARFADNVSRVRHRAALREQLAAAIAGLPCDVLLKKLHEKKVPATSIRNVQEVLEDQEVAHLLLKAEEGLQAVRTFVGHAEAPHLLPPPRLGEHTEAILRKVLNFSPIAIDRLRDRGIVG